MSAECQRLRLERLVGGELEAAERAEVLRHVGSCSDCSGYVALLEAERDAFLRQHPFSSFSRAHALVTPLPWYRRVPALLLRPAFAPAYGLLLVAAFALPLVIRHQRPDVQFKGLVPLSCVVKRGGEVHQMADGELFRSGDEIQIMFPVATRQYVCMISIDSRGTVSFYHPDRNSESCSVTAAPGASVTFPGSIIFDTTPGSELVIVLFSQKALARREVADWAARQFEASGDPATMQARLRDQRGALDAQPATLLLRKEL